MQKNRLDNLLSLLEKEPNDPFLLYATAFEYESMGEENRAMELYDKLLAQHPDYLPTYYQAGLLKSRLSAFEEALTILNKGIEVAQAQKEQKTLRELREAINMVEDEMD